MKNLIPFESQLSCWTPRRPSPKLKESLFPVTTVENDAPWNPVWWHWLAPATAVLLLSLAFVSQQHPLGTLATNSSLVATAMLSGPNPQMHLAAHHSDNNSFTVATFEWTNGSHSLTTAPPSAGTNSLLQ
jgi:hypothetical protein